MLYSMSQTDIKTTDISNKNMKRKPFEHNPLVNHVIATVEPFDSSN